MPGVQPYLLNSYTSHWPPKGFLDICLVSWNFDKTMAFTLHCYQPFQSLSIQSEVSEPEDIAIPLADGPSGDKQDLPCAPETSGNVSDGAIDTKIGVKGGIPNESSTGKDVTVSKTSAIKRDLNPDPPTSVQKPIAKSEGNTIKSEMAAPVKSDTVKTPITPTKRLKPSPGSVKKRMKMEQLDQENPRSASTRCVSLRKNERDLTNGV